MAAPRHGPHLASSTAVLPPPRWTGTDHAPFTGAVGDFFSADPATLITPLDALAIQASSMETEAVSQPSAGQCAPVGTGDGPPHSAASAEGRLPFASEDPAASSGRRFEGRLPIPDLYLAYSPQRDDNGRDLHHYILSSPDQHTELKLPPLWSEAQRWPRVEPGNLGGPAYGPDRRYEYLEEPRQAYVPFYEAPHGGNWALSSIQEHQGSALVAAYPPLMTAAYSYPQPVISGWRSTSAPTASYSQPEPLMGGLDRRWSCHETSLGTDDVTPWGLRRTSMSSQYPPHFFPAAAHPSSGDYHVAGQSG